METRERTLVGTRRRRQDGDLYVTGRIAYTGDIALPGMLHVALVRSPHAHARIVSIDHSAADAALVLTGEQALELAGPIPHGLDPGGLGGQHAEIRCLAVGKVVYVGEPVAAVVASSPADARAAARAVVVDYEPLPAVLDAEAALADGAPLLYDGWSSNVMLAGAFGVDDFDAIAARCGGKVSGTLRTHRGGPAPIETRAYVADWRDEQLALYATTQNPHPLRSTLAAALGLRESSVRVIAPPAGGSFGLKMYSHREETLVCVLARLAGRPVRWVEDRASSLQNAARDQRHEFEAAFDPDGRVRALRVRVVSDHGAASPGHGWGMAFVGAITVGAGYALESCRVEYKVVATNKPGWVGTKPFGKDGAALVTERAMDLVAEATGIDPAEVRRRNFLPPDALPYTMPSGIELDSGNYEGVLDKVLARVDYAAARAAQAEARGEGRLIGIGIAFELTPENADIPGALVGSSDTSTVRMDPSGSVTVLTGVTSPGNGNETAIAQIVADELGVALDDVRVVQGDSALCPYGYGNISSRSLVLGGGAAALAARDVAARLKLVAARMLEAESVELRGGRALAGGREVPLAEVARAVYSLAYVVALGVEPSLESTRTWQSPNIRHSPPVNPYATYPYALHAAVVEVDSETGVTTLVRHVVAHDCGVVVNPAFVDGQLRGGVAMAYGAAFGEELLFDGAGVPVTDGFKTYLMPRAVDLPPIEIEHQETPSPHTVLGAKGAGEAGFAGAQAAFFNAVCDATGKPLGGTPLSPAAVLEALA